MTEASTNIDTGRLLKLQVSLEKLLVSGRLHECVESILKNNKDFESCLRSASIHENSFIKVPVALGLPSTKRLRIHFWISPSDEQNVHDHRFDFSSAVISGSIENIIWRTVPNGREAFGFRYYHDQNGRRLLRQLASKIQVSGRYMYRAGDFYSVHRDTLHTINHTRDTVTVILEDRAHLKTYANVYSQINREVGYTPPNKVPKDLLWKKLSEFCLHNAVAN